MKRNNPQYNELTEVDKLPLRGGDSPIYQIDKAIPLEEQRRYYIASQATRQRQPHLTRQQLNDIEALLYNKRMGDNWHRNILIQLACTRQIEAYRMIEDFMKVAPPRLCNWTILAEFDARIAIESSLQDLETITIVTSGLGGRGNLVRFSSICATREWQPFELYQRELLWKEFVFALKAEKGEIEDVVHGESYIIFTYLIPFGLEPDKILRKAVSICNELGDFLDENTLRTTNINPIKESDIYHLRQMIQKQKELDL